MRIVPLFLLAAVLSPVAAFTQTTADPAELSPASTTMFLKYAKFDPATGEPIVPVHLQGGSDTNLWIVQLDGRPTDEMREQIRNTGAQLHGYLPENAYVVRMNPGTVVTVSELRAVRWVGPYHPAYRLEPLLVEESFHADSMPVRKYNIVVVDKHNDKPALGQKILALGGEITHEQHGSILFEVALSGPQVVLAARLDEVLWINRWSAPEEDMNNARIQGGGNYVEGIKGYTGLGLNGHIYEGLEPNNPDWNNTPISVGASPSVSSHGHNTAGIICGNGTSNPLGRGMAPDIQLYYTNNSTVFSGWSRWDVIKELVENKQGMFTSASWGGSRTFFYTSTSAAADDIVFDHDIPWTQSQSNAGDQDSRPEAWGKNIFSIGGVRHNDNSFASDDSWAAGGASTGPADDGRIKPDLCAYYDNILCSSTSGFTTSFGGTSGATPINAGHNAIAIEMFTDGTTVGQFGNPLRVPGGTIFQNRPHFSTLKALQIANATQYPFTASSSDNRREHCGWGFPDLETMYDNRNQLYIIDETDVLLQGQTTRHLMQVNAGLSELKIVMTYPDPAGNPSAQLSRINDLTLRVVAPDGTVYWGNNGLTQGNYSVPGGVANDYDTVECVFVQNPQAGNWKVDVTATLVAQDSHVETPAVDADYALVVNGGVYVGTGTPGSAILYGQSCPGTAVIPGGMCGGVNTAGGSSTASTYSAIYAYEYTAPQPMTITGFRLFTGSATGGTVTAATAFWNASSGSGPAAAPTATSTIQVSPTIQFYQSDFAAPISVPAGATFYVSCQHDNVYRADLTSGEGGTAWYNLGSGWGGTSGFVDKPSFQILCLPTTGVAPEFAISGAASIGTSMTMSLSQAAPNTSALLITGLSDQIWSGIGLPFNLGGLGAPLCDLLVSMDILVLTPVDATGSAQMTGPIPMDASLVGVSYYQQFAVIDPGANPLGYALTNGAAITIGD